MNLKEAIERADHARAAIGGDPEPVVLGRRVAEEILAAARKQLAAEEAANRSRLEGLERGIRACSNNVAPAWDSTGCHSRTADILKALRQEVVPWLRQIQGSGWAQPSAADDMLRALGEEP